MVASHYGYDCDLLILRNRFPISLKGATLRTIMRIADGIGFVARPLQVEPEGLNYLPLPTILHWNMNHFVVLTRITGRGERRRYHIADPALGERKVNALEFSRQFTGVALELLPAPNFRRQVQRVDLRFSQLWSRTRGLIGSMAQIVGLTVVMQVVLLITPFFGQYAIDTILPTGEHGLLAGLGTGFLLVAAVGIGAAFVRGYLVTNVGQLLGYQMIANVTRHLFRLPLTWFEKRQVGDVLSRLESTIPLGEFLSRKLLASLVDGIMAAATLILMLCYSWLLTLLVVTLLTAYATARLGLLGVYNRRNNEALVARGREHGMMIENLEGMSGIKAAGQEEERFSLWLGRKAEAVNRGTDVARVEVIWDLLEPAVRSVDSVVFVLVAVSMAMDGTLTIGMIFAFAAYKQQFLTAAFNLVQLAGTYRTLDVHLARIADIALSDPEPHDDRGLEGPPAVDGSIELCDVTFSYGTGEPEVLKGVSLTIAAGETVAVAGRSGGGKTTLLKVMLGVLKPTGGLVKVDGVELARFGAKAWRRQVGYVAQSDVLYSGSLAQNIAFFDANVDMDRVIDVAKKAIIHNDIMQMPMRYDTLVGDMGSTLSGGQRARILIARALYRNPRVLLIDEGSAHLDVETERLLNSSIEQLGITRVIVSHRPETLVLAERNFVLHDGHILEPREDISPE